MCKIILDNEEEEDEEEDNNQPNVSLSEFLHCFRTTWILGDGEEGDKCASITGADHKGEHQPQHHQYPRRGPTGHLELHVLSKQYSQRLQHHRATV